MESKSHLIAIPCRTEKSTIGPDHPGCGTEGFARHLRKKGGRAKRTAPYSVSATDAGERVSRGRASRVHGGMGHPAARGAVPRKILAAIEYERDGKALAHLTVRCARR